MEMMWGMETLDKIARVMPVQVERCVSVNVTYKILPLHSGNAVYRYCSGGSLVYPHNALGRG